MPFVAGIQQPSGERPGLFMVLSSLFGSKSSAPVPVQPEAKPAAPRPHIILIGNEKGGSGKTTTCMHLMVSLLRMGFRVGSMDIDARQRSLSRYIENRRSTSQKEGVPLPMPHHIILTKSPFHVQQEAEEDENERFRQAIDRLAACDFIIIDSPGNDTFLSRLAHSHADTIITPINDSFVDLDVLASVDGASMQIVRPSIYSEMVWEQKLARAKRDGGSIEWIVMRNRLSNLDARNKRQMKQLTEELSRRIGFRLAPGFSERVIYREMFLQGLTVLDVMDTSNSQSISMSHVAARQEVRELLKMLRIPEVDRRMAEIRNREENPDVKTTEAKSPGAKKQDAPTTEQPDCGSSSATTDSATTDTDCAPSDVAQANDHAKSGADAGIDKGATSANAAEPSGSTPSSSTETHALPEPALAANS